MNENLTDIYWGAYKISNIDCSNKMMFYMKDVYGLESGSEESVVNINDLINKFEKNKMKLLHNNSFLDEFESIPQLYKNYKIRNFQKEILNMNQMLVFSVN
jgi:hypothetical protein